MPPKKICPKMGVEKCLLKSVVILQDRRNRGDGGIYPSYFWQQKKQNHCLKMTAITAPPYFQTFRQPCF